MTKKRIVLLIFVLDFLILCASFLIAAWIKPGTVDVYLPRYYQAFLYFSVLWLTTSCIIGKYNLSSLKSAKDILANLLISNFTSLSILLILAYTFALFGQSRLIVLGTVFFATIMECIVWLIFSHFLKINKYFYYEPSDISLPQTPEDDGTIFSQEQLNHAESQTDQCEKHFLNIVEQESTADIAQFVCKRFSSEVSHTLLMSTSTVFNIVSKPSGVYKNVVNLKRINDVRRINKYFEAVNEKIPFGGRVFGCAETYVLRKERILNKYPIGLNYIIYTFDYLIKRVCPKLVFTKGIYFFFTHGRNRVISKAETFGRLYSCGFKIVEDAEIDGKLCFIAEKIKEPVFDFHPTYGPLIRLRRVGKGGKIIGVYKMRTMHAYSEYLQPYVYEKYNLKSGGKFENDFRINSVGRVMRKLWIDELPMFLNFFKGELKIVGIRPLSQHYFNLYDKELQEMRVTVKPGLVPPFYADMPKDLEEIIASEKKYIIAYKKQPFLTDWRYFWRAFYNIVVKKARSE